MDDPSYKNSGVKESQESPRHQGSRETKVKPKNAEGNLSKVYSSVDSKGNEKESVTLPPIAASRNEGVQRIHSPTNAIINGGAMDMASPESVTEVQPVIEKNKKSEFEATGTSLIGAVGKSGWPVTS
jgi:hypothetical protein